ncbi:TPR-like protein [Malassezia yamatoensis]|uniref:ER membrane protein complex subunit 2 n=1 Tax=Malassezia yamatoensis TaxID=253288 RepID=A0AAJ5YQ22_9BASI|nr:TPR-like protein [Malassezia yamatoensis]
MVEQRITLEEAVAWLHEQRVNPDRSSYDVVRYGEWILENDELFALGDDLWSFLEQLGLASAEMGKYELAELCLSRLTTRFPNSSRVVLFQGTVLESKGSLQEAQRLYESFLRQDPSHLLIVKRRIACLRSQADKMREATEALADFVDHFPLDQEAWQELASVYLEQNKYAQAAFALEELILLAPHNIFYLLQYAEVLYTNGDLAKAYKIYLRILELGDEELKPKNPSTKKLQSGPWVRALWGLKLCSAQLLANKEKQSDGEVVASKIAQIDALATDLLMTQAYAPDATDSAPLAIRHAARSCLGNAP